MDAETIKASTDVTALRERHVKLLQMVEANREGKPTELTEVAAVAEKILIKSRLRELNVPIRADVRTGSADSARKVQTVKQD